MEDLWQAHYQVLSIIFTKEFIELNVNTDMIIKKCETYGIKYKHLIDHKYLCCNKNCQQKFDEKWKQLFFNTYKFSKHDNTKFLLSLQKGVYPIWMVRESSKKHHYLKMKIFTVT